MPSIASMIGPTWTERLVQANGIRQHVWRTGGAKPPLVCLPGFSEIGITWLRFAHAFADRFDVVMVDFRGQGRTELGAEDYSQDTLTADVAALIPALGLVQPAVIGFSNGGAIATQLAAEHPALVGRLILEDPGWGPKPSGQKMAESPQYRAWFDSWLAWLEAFQRLSPEEQVAQIVPRIPSGGSTWPAEEIVPFAESMAQYDIRLARRSMALWSAPDKPVRDLITRVKAPTLFIRALKGGMPGAPPESEHRDVLATMPNVKLVEMDTGHFVRREAFDNFVAAVTEFLAG